MFAQILGASSQPSLEDQQRDIQEQFAARKDNQARAKSHESVGDRFLHVRHPVGAVFRTEPGTGRLPALRAANRSQNIRSGHMAGLRELHGESNILHDIQQGLPAGVQEGATLQVQEPSVAAVQVGLRPREAGDRSHQGLMSSINRIIDLRWATEAGGNRGRPLVSSK